MMFNEIKSAQDMKAMYLTPSTEVVQVRANFALLVPISGPGGMKDGGQAGDLIDPQ